MSLFDGKPLESAEILHVSFHCRFQNCELCEDGKCECKCHRKAEELSTKSHVFHS